MLSHPFTLDPSGAPYWFFGSLFLPFGLWALFGLLDFLYVEIREDVIEIKSVFRRRVILKKDVEGYGIEDYEGKHFKGERIRIITASQNIKFHSTQLESLLEIKRFLKGKKIIPGAFKRERIANIAAYGLVFIMIISLFFFDAQHKEDFAAVGIPVDMDSEFILLLEEGDEITFRIKNYENFTFVVPKANALPNLKNFKGKVLVFIDQPPYAEELSVPLKDGKTISKAPRIIPVTEVSELK